MSLWRRLTGPGNSLILFYDHLTDEGADEMEEQLREVGRYYRWTKLGDLCQALSQGSGTALAAVAFAYPRKSVLLRAVPILRAEKIPVTIFLPGDGVGMNRLPPEEELASYRETYPAAFTDELYQNFINLAWEDPLALEEKLLGFRREIGPLPLNSLDPTRFFSTWGKLVELPPETREFGFHVGCHPRHERIWSETLEFLERQTGSPLRVAYAERPFPEYARWGFSGVVGTRKGAVVPGVSLGELPIWDFSSTISE